MNITLIITTIVLCMPMSLLLKYLSLIINNMRIDRYSKLLEQIIIDCVIATNQTYVNKLKNKGVFDINAQKKAYEDTYMKIMQVFPSTGKICLANIYGDFELYVNIKIEAAVNVNKHHIKHHKTLLNE